MSDWMVSDWIAGAVYRVATDGTKTMLVGVNMGSADIEYIPERSQLIVPMMLDNQLVAYRIK